jgi:RNAse (barnase) inhibitor barstar
MSDDIYAHDAGLAIDPFGMSNKNLFDSVLLMRGGDFRKTVAAPGTTQSGQVAGRGESAGDGADEAGDENDARDDGAAAMNLFKTVRPNIVQSIRAFRVTDLAAEARHLNLHFLYANCAQAQTKAEVLERISTSFLFPKNFGKNYDALFDSLTDMVAKAGPQPGFVVVLEGLPAVAKFDKDARETLLDVFREAAEFWSERKVSFRVFYSFA